MYRDSMGIQNARVSVSDSMGIQNARVSVTTLVDEPQPAGIAPDLEQMVHRLAGLSDELSAIVQRLTGESETRSTFSETGRPPVEVTVKYLGGWVDEIGRNIGRINRSIA